MIWLQSALALLGLLHAAAAYFYFSKHDRALPWTLVWLVLSAGCIAFLPAWPYTSLGVFAGAVVAWTLWWGAIHPSIAHDWIVEDERQASGEVVDDAVIIRDLRNFHWLGRGEFTAHWETRRYALAKLSAVDLFVCTWGDPRIAHLIVSLLFDDQTPLAFSIETRRETSERWSMLAGFMRSYELIVIAADERDVIRLRTNVRHEQVARYRLRTTPQMRRRLFLTYLAEMNALAQRPRFYNTVASNCTTEVIRILRASGRRLPLDWRILVSGNVPEYLHALGLLEDQRPISVVRANADISALALAAEGDPAFSRLIRAVAAKTDGPKTASAERSL
jgi:hypothetical protein